MTFFSQGILLYKVVLYVQQYNSCMLVLFFQIMETLIVVWSSRNIQYSLGLELSCYFEFKHKN